MLLLSDIREPDVDISNGKNKEKKKKEVEKKWESKEIKKKMQRI